MLSKFSAYSQPSLLNPGDPRDIEPFIRYQEMEILASGLQQTHLESYSKCPPFSNLNNKVKDRQKEQRHKARFLWRIK